MTIADAFNEIAAAQGGEPNYSGTIAAAIDAVNDALAGSDQPAAQTIEGAVRLLGQHIGGGSSVTVEALTATENKTYTAPEGKAYSPVTVDVAPQEYNITCLDNNEPTASYVYKAIPSVDHYEKDTGSGAVNKAAAGDALCLDGVDGYTISVLSDTYSVEVGIAYESGLVVFYMPPEPITADKTEE